MSLLCTDELESTEETPGSNGIWDTVKFAFEIEQVTVALYWKEPKLVRSFKAVDYRNKITKALSHLFAYF